MARGVNKVILVGNLGQDPEIKYTTSNLPVVNVSLATTDSWTDKSGQKQDRTEWHRLVFFGKLAEITGQYLKKGGQVYVEGRLQTRQWEKNGQTMYTTEIIVSDMQMLGGRGDGGSRSEGGYQGGRDPFDQSPAQSHGGGRRQPTPAHQGSGGTAANEPPPFDDDIPF